MESDGNAPVPARNFLRARRPSSSNNKKKPPTKKSKSSTASGKGKKRAHGDRLSEPPAKRVYALRSLDAKPAAASKSRLGPVGRQGVKKMTASAGKKVPAAGAKGKGKSPPKGKKVAAAKGKGKPPKGKAVKKGTAPKGKAGKKGAAPKGKAGMKSAVPKGKGGKPAINEKKAKKVAVAEFKKGGKGKASHGANMFVLFFMDRLRNNPQNFYKLAKECSKLWKKMPDAEKMKWRRVYCNNEKKKGKSNSKICGTSTLTKSKDQKNKGDKGKVLPKDPKSKDHGKSKDPKPKEHGKSKEPKPKEHGKSKDPKPKEHGKSKEPKPKEHGKSKDPKPKEHGKSMEPKPKEHEKSKEPKPNDDKTQDPKEDAKHKDPKPDEPKAKDPKPDEPKPKPDEPKPKPDDDDCGCDW